MALTVGIIGLPQSGKTTVYNALTKAGAPVSGYPTGTVQANLAVVNVPDDRVDRLSEMFVPKKKTYATVEFVDVAGMASTSPDKKREGLSAEFLGHIRNANALSIVVRCFNNASVPHPSGSIDAARDIDDLLLTLALTDLQSVEQRIERSQKMAKSGDKKYAAEVDLLKRLKTVLDNGGLATDLEYTAQERAMIDELFLLTMKPRMYIANVSESALKDAGDIIDTISNSTPQQPPDDAELQSVHALGLRAQKEQAIAVAVSARLEAELIELSPEDAAEYLDSLGLPKLGTDRVIQAGYKLLDLITFLTAGEDEVRAWTVRVGSKAPAAAGKIHTDIERGFIRAEVIRFEDLIAAGSFAAAREKGLLRLEGKEYIIQDGDIAHFRFNVSK